MKIDGPLGFYLVNDPAAAEYFALRRLRGMLLRYTLTAKALTGLLERGARLDRIPPGAFRFALPGLELVTPPEAFAEFNALRSTGQISLQSYRTSWE